MAASNPPTEPVPPSVPAATATATPAPAPRPNRLPLYAGVGAAAVVVLLLLVFVLGPALSGSSSPGSSGGSALTYDQAKPIADKALAGYQGGGWAILVGVGVAPITSEVLPLNLSALSVNCTFSPNPSAPSNLTISGYNGSRSAGVATAWDFIYRNGASVLEIVAVVNGQAIIFGSISGGLCSTAFALLSTPSGVIDSSAAASAVASYSASFLASYPNASSEYFLVGGISFGALLSQGPTWGITYTTCSLSPTASGYGEQFNATVNATSGQVIYHQTASAACGSGTSPPPTTPLGTALSFGFPTTSTNGTTGRYTTSIPVSYATSGITWSNFTATLENSSFLPVSTGWSMTAQNLAGTLIATYSLATGTWVGPGAQLPIASGDQLVLSSTFDPSTGYFLTLSGVGAFSGSIQLYL